MADKRLTIKNRHSIKSLHPVPGLLTAEPIWKRALNRLASLDKGKTEKATGIRKRIQWLLSFPEGGDSSNEDLLKYDDVPQARGCPVSITAREQSLGKSGQWSKGKEVNLSTLFRKCQDMDHLDQADLKICRAIGKKKIRVAHYRRKKLFYYFHKEKLLEALIDHKELYLADSPEQKVAFVRREPRLNIVENKGNYELTVSPELSDTKAIDLVWETPERLGVITRTAAYEEIATIVNGTLKVPVTEKKLVQKAVSAISAAMDVHTDIPWATSRIKEVVGDSKPCFSLRPYGDALKCELTVKPLKSMDALYVPGRGVARLVLAVDGESIQLVRNLESEKKRAVDAIAACPILSDYPDGSSRWYFDDMSNCLELLTQLKTYDDLTILWPEGEKIRVSEDREFEDVTVRVSCESDWFAVEGELKVDDTAIIDLKNLIKLSAASKNRFIQMTDGTWLALTQKFKDRLDDLASYSVKGGGALRFSPLAIPAVEEFTSQVGNLEGDEGWDGALARFTGECRQVTLPSTFQAKLRDYQMEAFHWLSTLSHWKAGACLADDMGLGKTIEALSIILLKAGGGPSLVVAPVSVLMNWATEAFRFAPTLKVANLSRLSKLERSKIISGAEPYDLVLTTYGLLVTEGDLLNEVKWQTLVLDEAQAIKNPSTKRAKAAMKLLAEFKIVTTGTPVENHLGELWSIFNFINPGLLGSLESFNQRFAIPIERDNDGYARTRLKKLVRPFILRRLKQDVLTELPPRTEITLQVGMSDDESALYEAYRQLSLDEIEESQNNENTSYIKLFAQLTRLRRFCCNPELITGNTDVPSSKLALFEEVIDELLDNGHKALVFSQFVSHLAIIKRLLDKKKVSYQYLDGSTPVKKREKAVNAFQGGEGDIFLISLKAGGTGLNLTAADYVIHMDPWWNPAVEDQASDRSHRIGQTRPVTVYRLVVENSIEEKIMKLHSTKRNLADTILEGSDSSARLSAGELLSLIREP